jgi:hypothetical protein
METSSQMANSNPIDVVIAWVDGNDPVLTEKRNGYLTGSTSKASSNAHPTRFASINEIKYCVLSILKFAPFVRNVFIVTDGQDPNIWEDVRLNFPNRLNSIRIVDHKEIFRGYEAYLPTFNSISIGNMVWRVKGLSDNFVYFNDDVILIREVKPEDWVINNRPVIRGRWRIPPYVQVVKHKLKIVFNRQLLGNRDYYPKFSFYLVQWNVAWLVGMRFRFFFNCHTPHVVNRIRLEEFYTKNIELLKENISYRFRSQTQFNMTTLANHLEIKAGSKNLAKLNLGYLNPSQHSERRLNRKIRRCERDTTIKSICVQSLDTASPRDQKRIFSWMDNVLGLTPSQQQ